MDDLSEILRVSIPVRHYAVEERNDLEQSVRIVIPRFGTSILGRILSSVAVRTEEKINLDAFGSFVYRACDGTRTVQEIAGALREQFGAGVEPLDERLALFMRNLVKRGLISFVKDERIRTQDSLHA